MNSKFLGVSYHSAELVFIICSNDPGSFQWLQVSVLYKPYVCSALPLRWAIKVSPRNKQRSLLLGDSGGLFAEGEGKTYRSDTQWHEVRGSHRVRETEPLHANLWGSAMLSVLCFHEIHHCPGIRPLFTRLYLGFCALSLECLVQDILIPFFC